MIEAFTSPPYSPESNHAHAPRLFSFFLFNKAVSSGRSAQARTRRKVTNDSSLLTSSNRASNRRHREMATPLNEEVRSVLGGFEYNRTCLTPESRREPMKWCVRQTSGLPCFGFNRDQRRSNRRLLPIEASFHSIPALRHAAMSRPMPCPRRGDHEAEDRRPDQPDQGCSNDGHQNDSHGSLLIIWRYSFPVASRACPNLTMRFRSLIGSGMRFTTFTGRASVARDRGYSVEPN